MIVLSQLSKKFKIAEVLDQESMKELDEGLAAEITNRLDSRAAMHRYFSGAEMPAPPTARVDEPSRNTYLLNTSST